MKAFGKDILRTIAHNKKRFSSMAIITALGVTMFTGLSAGCDDLRQGADDLFDEQDQYDIQVVSTLGLTDEDVEALLNVEGVEKAFGIYYETVLTEVDEAMKEGQVEVIYEDGLGTPTLINGELPSDNTEIAVTEGFLEDTGAEIGDVLVLETEDDDDDSDEEEDTEEEDSDEEEEEDDESDGLNNYTFVITGTVLDSADLVSDSGSASYRSSNSVEYYFYVDESAVESDIYTAIEITVTGAKELSCYSDEYKDLVEEVCGRIEQEIKQDREQARYYSVVSEAQDELDDSVAEIDEEFADAEAEIADAEQEIADGWDEIEEAEAEIADAEAEIADGWTQIEEAELELSESTEEIEDGWAAIDEAKEELTSQEESTYEQIDSALETLYENLETAQSALAQLESAISIYSTSYQDSSGTASSENDESSDGTDTESSDDTSGTSVYDTYYAQIAELTAQITYIEENIETLTAQRAEAEAQFEAAWEEIAANEAELTAGEEAIEEAKAQIEASKQELRDGEAEIEEAKAELEDAKEELYDGEAEIEDAKSELEDSRAEADEEIADAQAEIDDIDTATWYVRDRSYLESYSTVQSDADSIESIGTIFPIMFLAVAILISLTTITRMVEENRGLIGLYKALGFKNRAIYLKYFAYTMSACAAGGIAGCFFGFVALPKFLFTVFAAMYELRSYPLVINWAKGVLGIVMFMIAIVGAALLTCRGVLSQMPATLMRPKTPRAGSRIFLERIGFIWKRLKFLNKVTARNLFRYKKRLLMTIAGICGCTALVIVGLSIRDTVTNLRPSQYDEVYAYDIMAVSLAEDFEDVEAYISQNDEITDYITLEVSSIEVLNTENDEMQTVQLYVVPDDESLAGYITLKNSSGTDLDIPDEGIFVTENMADVMYFDSGDTLQLQTLDLNTAYAEVAGIVDNYLGNAVYISESYYDELFGDYETNAVMAHLAESCEDPVAFTEALDDELDLISCLSTQELKDDFSMSFQLINSVVVVVTMLAAALAFVVLFTLATTNISEREREIATIKVLGFYDREVHLYINKETMILTSIGIVLGLPTGYLLSMALEVVLHLPAVNYAAVVAPVSFVFAAMITFAFALIVNLFTNKTLDNVVMVEALKSVE